MTKKLYRLNKTIVATIESFRGVNMDAFTALTEASSAINRAIADVRAGSPGPRPQPVPIKQALFGKKSA